ncbi:MAG: xanthine dehydrogenase family protein molybdopterin-binding subunit [Acetobacteraceae bacterium]|nr:xanthine dehydrogenase family protein molybdopterin-binding subunit [Acetobacteraceae bacterium]
MPTRRDLLRASAGLVVSFTLARHAMAGGGEPDQKPAAGSSTAPKPVALDQVDSYLAIAPDNRVTLYSGKVDLGTGIETAFTQILAEELEVPAENITFISGDTLLTPDQGPTFGSLSIQSGGMQLRQAAATARKALLAMAADRFHVEPTAVTLQAGRVIAGERSVPYGDLLADQRFALKVDPNAPTKNPATFKVVGTSVPRADIPPKVTGRFTYMQDYKVDGMLHGRVVRPSGIRSSLQSVDRGSVQGIPGIVSVVQEGNFLGVVAETEWAAIRGAQALKATWSDWQGLPEQSKLFETVRATKVEKDEITSSTGDPKIALDKAARKLKATYEFAIHTHGSIGPSCAIVAIADNKLTCWTASQSTHKLREQLATMLSMPRENVRCIYVEGSGCYGRNGHEDAAADAAVLSRAVGGRPVRVQWSRADEHGWDPKGPPTMLDLQAGLDDQGNVVAWQSELFICATSAPFVPLLAANLTDLPREHGMAPGGVTGDSAIPYAFPAVHTMAHRLADAPLRPAWIRTPGRMQNTFANESFMDELAAAANADPLAFRLKYLKDPRGIELLHRLAALAKWDARPSPQRRQGGDVATGRGMSYVKYELNRTYIGAVAEVEVKRSTGEIRVTRFNVAHDCGQIINPDGLRNQIEGNVIQTVSRTLMEEVTFNRSHVTSLDWASYPIITFPDVPDVVMDLIDRPNEKPWGAGEPTAAVVPSAVGNAVFDAIGVRLRSVPMKPEKVLAALRAT